MIRFNAETLPERYLHDPEQRKYLALDSEFDFAVEDASQLPTRLKIKTDTGKHKIKLTWGQDSNAAVMVRMQHGSEIYIGKNLKGWWDMTAFSDSKIVLQGESTTRGKVVVNCGFGNYFELGLDAMLAEDVRFNIGDQHAIIDLQSCLPINSARSSLICGNHLWLGY